MPCNARQHVYAIAGNDHISLSSNDIILRLEDNVILHCAQLHVPSYFSGFDPLCDVGVKYTSKLQQVGNKVEWVQHLV